MYKSPNWPLKEEISKVIPKELFLCRVNELYSLDRIDDKYWFLLSLNIIWNVETDRVVEPYIQNMGYPSYTFSCKPVYNPVTDRFIRPHGVSVTMHKIVALACINNGPYEVIEHIDDNPLNCTVGNLKFSTNVENSKRAFVNGHRFCPEAKFEAILPDGSYHKGTMNEISAATGIPRMTLYDRYYKGPYDPNHKFAQPSRIKVLSCTKIEEAPPMKYLSHRFIDYRKDSGNVFIVRLDNINIAINRVE